MCVLQGAAAWLNGEEAVGRQRAREQALKDRVQKQQAAQSRGAIRAAALAEAAAAARGPSHAELIAQARRANEPISINGENHRQRS